MEQTASEPISIRLSRDHFEEEIDVRPLGDGFYEILETPMLYGRVDMDVVRLRPMGEGVFRVAEIIRRPYRHYCWTFRRSTAIRRALTTSIAGSRLGEASGRARWATPLRLLAPGRRLGRRGSRRAQTADRGVLEERRRETASQRATTGLDS